MGIDPLFSWKKLIEQKKGPIKTWNINLFNSVQFLYKKPFKKNQIQIEIKILNRCYVHLNGDKIEIKHYVAQKYNQKSSKTTNCLFTSIFLCRCYGDTSIMKLFHFLMEQVALYLPLPERCSSETDAKDIFVYATCDNKPRSLMRKCNKINN